nr:immunoglobulin light chain junction region [Macaca mulatta]
CVQALAFPFTF